MASDYINSAEQTMTLVRSIAAHLAEEPNLPAPEHLTRGEVDAWIRALETGINGRVIDMLALPVLECLLYKRGRNLAWKVKHLRRAPCEKFRPVIVNPWISAEGVPSNHNQLPWIPGDRHQPIEVNDNAEDLTDSDEEISVADQDDIMEEDFTQIDGEGTQLNDSSHKIDKDNDSSLTTQQSIDQQDDAALLNTIAAETAEDIRSVSVDDENVAMQDVLEHNDSEADRSTPDNTDNEKPTQPTSPDTEGDPAAVLHDEGRTRWCVCDSDDTSGIMVECKNCEDPDCKGKWYHTTCVGLLRPPAEHVDWYCGDCRKKLRLGVYSNGCVDNKRKPNQATGRTRKR